MASTALESIHSNTEEPSIETSSFQTDQLEVTSANASSDAQMTPKRCQSKERPWGVVRKKMVCFKEEKEIISIWEEGEWNWRIEETADLGKSTAEVAGLSFNQGN